MKSKHFVFDNVIVAIIGPKKLNTSPTITCTPMLYIFSFINTARIPAAKIVCIRKIGKVYFDVLKIVFFKIEICSVLKATRIVTKHPKIPIVNVTNSKLILQKVNIKLETKNTKPPKNGIDGFIFFDFSGKLRILIPIPATNQISF